MRGKVLFFSEEKGFGKIIDSEKNEYFFYINKIKNKPEKINKDDEVEFEYYENSKGLRAENISFIIKIKCPVCSSMNLENEKNCKNVKCKFELTCLKDGAFIASSEEIDIYNIKLQQAKDNYINRRAAEDFKEYNDLDVGSNKSQQQNISSNLTIKIYELKYLVKDEFESTKDFNERIKSYEYIKIGKYKLLNYNADTEQYEINIEIDKKEEQILDYEFDKLTILHIPKDKAQQLKAKNLIHDIFAKLEYNGTKYIFNTIKFANSDVEITESELINAIKNGMLIVAGLALMLGIGIYEAGKFIYKSIFSDKNSNS